MWHNHPNVSIAYSTMYALFTTTYSHTTCKGFHTGCNMIELYKCNGTEPIQIKHNL